MDDPLQTHAMLPALVMGESVRLLALTWLLAAAVANDTLIAPFVTVTPETYFPAIDTAEARPADSLLGGSRPLSAKKSQTALFAPVETVMPSDTCARTA